MDKYIHNLGIHILLIIYFIVNIYFKKYYNLALITSLFGVIYFIIRDYKNAIIISYIISVVYGIYKNFYLIENFKTQDKEIDISKDENLITVPREIPKNNLPKIDIKKDIKLKNFDIKSLINDELLDNFMQKLKQDHVSIIYNKKVKVDHLQPTLKELNLKKITEMKNNDSILAKPIIISKDNFIIDGHHRWYSVTSNNNDSYMNNQYSVKKNLNFINSNMINLDVNEIIRRIKVFKYNHNKNSIKSSIDKKRVNESRKLLNEIKNNVNKLDKYFLDIDNIKLI
jgi:hypothetical protein